MVAAMAAFVVNDSLVKLATTHYATGQLLVLRGVVAIASALALVWALGQLSSLSKLTNRLVLLRGCLEGFIAYAFILALAHLQLANITAILQAASLVIVALAALLGIDQVGWRRWLAVLVGFIGVLLIVKPGLDGFTVYSLIALACSLMAGVRDLMTRRIQADVPSPVVAVASTIAVTLVGLGTSLAQPWQPIALRETLYLAGAGVLVSLGNFWIIVAYRHGNVTVVSALRYTVLLFALVIGFAVWGDWPDGMAMIGAVLIVVSGLYAMHRQRVRSGKVEP